MPGWLRTVLAPYLWLMGWISKLGVAQRLEEHIQRSYVPLLRRALRWRCFTIAAAVAVLILREERASLYHVDNLIIRTPSGGEMPVAEAASVSRGRAYTIINRIDGRRYISITADIADEDTNSNEINAQIRQRELPQLVGDMPGLAYDLSGEQQRQAETLNALGLGYLLALITIFSLLAILFHSYAQPLLVMSGIPFGMVGAVWGHVVMVFNLSIMSMFGLVALSGVVVNDSLILIVAINRYREQEGLDLWEAVLAGGARRFRPILLTSLTTFFGLAPLILEDARRALGNLLARLQGNPTIPPPSQPMPTLR